MSTDFQYFLSPGCKIYHYFPTDIYRFLHFSHNAASDIPMINDRQIKQALRCFSTSKQSLCAFLPKNYYTDIADSVWTSALLNQRYKGSGAYVHLHMCDGKMAPWRHGIPSTLRINCLCNSVHKGLVGFVYLGIVLMPLCTTIHPCMHACGNGRVVQQQCIKIIMCVTLQAKYYTVVRNF